MTSGNDDSIPGAPGGVTAWDSDGNPIGPVPGNPAWDSEGNPLPPAHDWAQGAAPPPAAWQDTVPRGVAPPAPAPAGAGWTPAHPADIADIPAAHRLPLGEEDRLPWLESAEDEVYEHIDGKRVAGVVIGGLAVLAAIIGGLWWGTHHDSGTGPAADGSTVAAPAGPYKTAPASPGGTTVAGTGDTSYAVSQGKTVQEHLADGAAGVAGAAGSAAQAASAAASDAASAGADAAKAAGAAAAGVAAGAEHAAGHAGAAGAGAAAAGAGSGSGDAAWSGGIAQIGAYYSQARAAAAWDELARTHNVLTGARHRIVSAVVDSGTVWRVQLLTATGAADAMCAKVKAAGLACQVKH